MEESQSIQFWIVSRQDDPGRIEVPVDAGSDIIDIIHPIHDGTDADMRYMMDTANKELVCESPVDVSDVNHYRSISTCTVSTVASAPSISEELRLPGVERLALHCDQDWNMSLYDQGCASGRSYDSLSDELTSMTESSVDTYTIIEEFDSLMKSSLPEIRVCRAFRGRRSLLQEFDLGGGPPVPHKQGGDQKGFGFSFQSGFAGKRPAEEVSTAGKTIPKFSGFGDLRRRISRFMSMSSKSVKAAVPEHAEAPIAEEPHPACPNEMNNGAVAMELGGSPVNGVVISKGATDADGPPCGPRDGRYGQSGRRPPSREGRDSVDFLLLIPTR